MRLVSTARHDDGSLFREMEQGAWINVVVMVMREENRRRLGQERGPQRRHRRFGKPGQQPGIEEEDLILLSVQQRRMPKMHRLAVLHHVEPALPDRILG